MAPSPALSINLADVEKMLAECGISDDTKVWELHEWLTEEMSLASPAQNILDLNAGLSKEAKNEIRRLAKSIGKTATAISEISEEVRNVLSLAYGNHLGGLSSLTLDQGGEEVLVQDMEALARLSQELDDALGSLSKGGRPGLQICHPIARSLAQKYEAISGSKFTFDVHEVNKGEREFIPPGSRFVAKGLKLIFPDLTSANLVTLLKNI